MVGLVLTDTLDSGKYGLSTTRKLSATIGSELVWACCPAQPPHVGESERVTFLHFLVREKFFIVV